MSCGLKKHRLNYGRLTSCKKRKWTTNCAKAGFNQRKVDYLSQVCKSGWLCVCVCMREGHAYHVKLVMSDESA